MASDKRANKLRQVSSALTFRDKSNRVPRLTFVRAQELVREILRNDDGEVAAFLIELVSGIAYEPGAGDRHSLATGVAQEAFTVTDEFSERVEAFATKAAMRARRASK